MPDTRRTLSALQTLLADNTSGDISPQDIRDMLVSVYAGGLSEISNQTVTTTDITGAVGNFYVCTIAGLTANRNLTLPSASPGERIGVHVLDGDDTYALILKGAASQTINGGSAATEWSRVFIKGETVIFRCIAANTWVVESDGRIAQIAKLKETTATTLTTGVFTKITLDSEVYDNSDIADPSTNNRITVRRSGYYSVELRFSISGVADQHRAIARIYKNGSLLDEVVRAYISFATSTTGVFTGASRIYLSAGDYLELYGFWSGGAGTLDTDVATTVEPFLQVKEVLQ